ncbi:EamA-like transporter family protein [Roseibium hamelinense]|uniref:EamA-like transporter family protein n=1 Tax=Roseibium hamelinense TaxID=150831 RepID=A0A562T7D4_9HYPH|nr:DMT family transporter [Roseibium hamelinense]MTI42819.1 DMT family transporter [Roseibium hamelinense]TWI89485.1 EamA-like transporter family protein [Roseibium hamelinense]
MSAQQFSPTAAPAPSLSAINPPDAPRGVLTLLASVGTMLAVSAILAKAAPGAGWQPVPFLMWSLLGAALLQFALMGVKRSRSSKVQPDQPQRAAGTMPGIWDGKLLMYLVISGGLFAAPNAIAFTAAQHVGAGFIALCFAFPLVLTYGLSLAFGLERLDQRRALGVTLGLLGGVILALGGRTMGAAAGFWAIAALSVPIVIAAANIYRSLRWPKGANPLLLSAGMMATGFVMLFGFSFAAGSALAPETWSRAAFMVLLAQTLVFAVQYVLYFELQKRAGPVYLSQIGSVGAGTGLVLAFLVFGEVPTLPQLASVALVGVGIVFVSRKRHVS